MHGLAHVASYLRISLGIGCLKTPTFTTWLLTSSACVVLRGVDESNAPRCSRMLRSGSTSDVGSGGLLCAMMTLTSAGLVFHSPACQVQDCQEMHGSHDVPLSLSLPHHTQCSLDTLVQSPRGKRGSCLLWDRCAPSFSAVAFGGVPLDHHRQTDVGEQEKSMGLLRCSSS